MKMKYKLAGIVVACVVALAALWWIVSGISQSEVTLDVNQEIDLTPEQITSIEAIGECQRGTGRYHPQGILQGRPSRTHLLRNGAPGHQHEKRGARMDTDGR